MLHYRKKSIIFVLEVLIGAAIGIIGFAKILGITLTYLEAETIFWFMGLILFSVPIIVRNELKGEKLAMLEMRSHVAWYIKGKPGSAKVKDTCNKQTDFNDVIAILKEYLDIYIT